MVKGISKRKGCIKIETSFHFVIINIVKGLENRSWRIRDSSLSTNDEFTICHNRMDFPQEIGTQNDITF